MIINFMVYFFFILFSLDKSITDSIKGISAIMILFSHINQIWGRAHLNYYDFGCGLEKHIARWGVLGVANFFFLSGYGIFTSLKKMQIKYTYINLMYMISLVSYMVLPVKVRIVGIFCMCIACISITPSIGIPKWWLQTTPCYVMGMMLAKHKNKIDKLLDNKILIMTCVGLICFCFSYNYIVYHSPINLNMLMGTCCIFILGVFIVAKIIFFESKLFTKISFPLYMIHTGIISNMKEPIFDINNGTFIFVSLSIFLSCITSNCSKYLFEKCERLNNINPEGK